MNNKLAVNPAKIYRELEDYEQGASVLREFKGDVQNNRGYHRSRYLQRCRAPREEPLLSRRGLPLGELAY